MIYGRFFTNKKIQFFFLELENVSSILSKKIGSFYALEQVENKSFWWPTAFLQTVGHFGHLLTPAVKQLVWEGDEKMRKYLYAISWNPLKYPAHRRVCKSTLKYQTINHN